MKKLLLSSVLATSIFAGLCTPVFASTNATYVSDDAIVSVCELSDGVTKASWGQGTLTSKNPLGQKPWAYAKTSTYSGNAYKLRAQTIVNNDGISTDSTLVAEKMNTSSVQSLTLTAKTEKCTFTGKYSLQDTSSSGWQTATTSKTY